MKASVEWFCIGIPPRIPPCGASGTSDRDAERHMKDSKHCTTAGTPRGAAVIHQAFTTTGDRA